MKEECYYRLSVKGIVIDNAGRILLAREADGRWEMLGGGLDHDEDPIVGLKREIAEETGLEVTYMSPSPKYFVTAPRIKDGVVVNYTANVIYQIELKSLDFIPSDECQELRFFSIADMEAVELLPNVRNLLELLKKQAGAQ